MRTTTTYSASEVFDKITFLTECALDDYEFAALNEEEGDVKGNREESKATMKEIYPGYKFAKDEYKKMNLAGNKVVGSKKSDLSSGFAASKKKARNMFLRFIDAAVAIFKRFINWLRTIFNKKKAIKYQEQDPAGATTKIPQTQRYIREVTKCLKDKTAYKLSIDSKTLTDKCGKSGMMNGSVITTLEVSIRNLVAELGETKKQLEVNLGDVSDKNATKIMGGLIHDAKTENDSRVEKAVRDSNGDIVRGVNAYSKQVDGTESLDESKFMKFCTDHISVLQKLTTAITTIVGRKENADAREAYNQSKESKEYKLNEKAKAKNEKDKARAAKASDASQKKSDAAKKAAFMDDASVLAGAARMLRNETNDAGETGERQAINYIRNELEDYNNSPAMAMNAEIELSPDDVNKMVKKAAKLNGSKNESAANVRMARMLLEAAQILSEEGDGADGADYVQNPDFEDMDPDEIIQDDIDDIPEEEPEETSEYDPDVSGGEGEDIDLEEIGDLTDDDKTAIELLTNDDADMGGACCDESVMIDFGF